MCFKCSEDCKCLKSVFGVAAVLFLAVLIVWFGVGVLNKIKEGRYIGQQYEVKTITVSATGEIYTAPDLAIVDLSVVTEAKTVAEAMSENTKKMNTIIDAAKKQGVEDKDLKTTNFYISPRYEWYQEEKCLYPPCPSGKRVLVGYEITQTLQVKIRDLTKIGAILQGATDAGANQVGDLQLTNDKQDELKKQARDEAIQKAKTKAQDLAEQLGVKLVRITNFNESGVVPTPIYMMEKAVGMGGAEAPQIQTGQNKIEVTVSITYEIN